MGLPRVFLLGAVALLSPMSSLVPGAVLSARQAGACGGEYYVNVDGRCVHRPVHADRAPAGATAKCRDGTYSFSQHRQGTCSRHGGVAIWL